MMRSVVLRGCALAAVVWAASLTPAGAATGNRDRFPIARAASAPALDPRLADPAWASTPAATGFIDLATKAPAAQRTSARVLYDDRAVYVAFEVEQTAALTAAQSTDDVGIGTDDFVGFGLDVAGNGERVYYFFVTPRGTKYEQASKSARYRPVWSAAAAPNAHGWNAVMRIPYSAFRLPGNGPQRWKFNFIRNIGATAEHDTWAFSSLMSYQPLPNWPDLVREWRFWPSATGVSLTGAVPRPKPRAEFYGLESTGSNRDRFTLTAGVDIALPIAAALHAGAKAPPPVRPRTFGWQAAVLAVVAILALAVGPAAGAHRTASADLRGDAARSYALGRYHWDQRSAAGLTASIAEFRRVIALAPKNPLGYDGLADAFMQVADYHITSVASERKAHALSERFARTALALDARSGEALATLGAIALDRDHDVGRAQRLLREALAAAPNHANAHEYYGVIRMYLGDVPDAVAHFRRATELDPLSVPILAWYGMALYFDSRYDDARAVLRDALALDPNRNDARYHLVLVDERLARVEEARTLVRELARNLQKRGDSEILAALLDLGSHARPVSAIAAVRPPKGADPFSLAALDVALGRRDAAVQRLVVALRDPGEHISRGMLSVDPRFAGLHGDPRFRSLTSG